MTSRLSELKQAFDTLLNATTALEICNGVAYCHHYQEGKEGEPLIPTPNDIKRYETVQILHDRNGGLNLDTIRDMYPVQVRQMFGVEGPIYQTLEISDALDAVQDELENIDATVGEIEQSHPALWEKSNVLFVASVFFGFGVFLIESLEERIEAIHKNWLETRDYVNMPHPLAPIVRAWLTEQMPKVEIEKREKQIAPAFLKGSRITKGDRLPTGFLHTQGADSPQLQLPSFDGTEDDIVVHALPLEMYQGGGGGRGAPLDERIFFNALLARPYGTPELWNGVKLEPTLRNFVDWLYPNGWNRTNQLPLLRKALHDVHNKRISYERRDWNVVQVLAMPNQSTALDDVLPLIIRYPDGVKGNGPMINVPRLRQYGLVSATKWRAWIRLHYLWDAANQRNGGNKIHSTIPQVKKNDKGYLLDAQGDLILTGAPYKTTRGRWGVRRGDKPQTAWYHPQAIHIGNERNPQCDKIPVLTDKQLVALFYDDTPVDVASFSERKKVAMAGLMDFEEDGVVVVERDAIDTKMGVKGWRTIPVYQH